MEKELEELQDFTRLEKRNGMFNEKIKQCSQHEEVIKKLNEDLLQKDIQYDVVNSR